MTGAPTLALLLSPVAEIVHVTKRRGFEKRLVRYDDQSYVMYRFSSLERAVRLAEVLEASADAGAAVQAVMAQSATPDECRRFGAWVALSWVPGVPLGLRPSDASLVSLARNLARLHSLQGPRVGFLFQGGVPELPHRAFVKTARVSGEPARRLEQGMARLQGLRGAQLTHGDLYGKNVIVTHDDSIALVDFDLMAYDLCGIELAMAMLRPFCRDAMQRQLFLHSYLDQCSAEVRESWDAHAHDFILAGAARLTIQRERRVRNLVRKRMVARLKDWVRFRETDCSTQESRRLQENLELALRQRNLFSRVTNAALALSAGNPAMDPLTLVTNSLARSAS